MAKSLSFLWAEKGGDETPRGAVTLLSASKAGPTP